MSNASRDYTARLTKTLGNRTDLFEAVYRDTLHANALSYRALDEVLNDSETEHRIWSVSYLDADGLKRVNDTISHEAGDRFLRDIVDLWYKNTRSWDRADSLIFRIGGDEFVILWFEDSSEGHNRLTRSWARFFAECSPERGVTAAWEMVTATQDARAAVTQASLAVNAIKAGRARTEVEALRRRVAELEETLRALSE
jgi:diguanylate cyclase (GGDEF)-like protein